MTGGGGGGGGGGGLGNFFYEASRRIFEQLYRSFYDTAAADPDWVPMVEATSPSLPYMGDPDLGATPTGDAVVEVLQTLSAVGSVKDLTLSTVATTAAKAAGRGAAKGAYAADRQVRGVTKLQSAMMKSEGDARALAKTMLGPNPVQVAPNKLRSENGLWQYRAKPGDYLEGHVHLERLDPRTGIVQESWHLKWPARTGR